jgi:hypothetical protein
MVTPVPTSSELRLAEAPNAYEPLGAGEQLIVRDSFMLFLGRGDHAGANNESSARATRLAKTSTNKVVQMPVGHMQTGHFFPCVGHFCLAGRK